MDINIKEKYSGLTRLKRGESTKTISFCPSGSAIPMPSTFILHSAYILDKAYSPEYAYTQCRLLDAGNGDTYQLQIKRGSSKNTEIYIYYTIIYSTQITVYHLNTSFTDSTKTISGSFLPENSFPITSINTVDKGQGIEDFMINVKIGSSKVELKKDTAKKEINANIQIIESSKFDVSQNVIQTHTNPKEVILPEKYDKYNTFLIMTYSALSCMRGTGYYKRAYINNNNNIIIDNNSKWVSKTECVCYAVKVNSSGSVNKGVINTKDQIQKINSNYKDFSNILTIASTQYNHLNSTDEKFNKNHSEATGMIKENKDNNEINYIRNFGSGNPKGMLSILRSVNFVYLHHVGRGSRVGVGVGIG